MTMDTPGYKRQMWLEQATEALRKRFDTAGFTCPELIRVSCGFPKGGGTKGSKAIGQCWSNVSSEDGHAEIFVSPEISDNLQVIGVLAHELVHATVGLEAKHGGKFKTVATLIGLEGKMTATESGEDLKIWSTELIKSIGLYPFGKLNVHEVKKQSTRLLKCECSQCGYIARVTAKWVNSVGGPLCPTDHVPMTCDKVSAGEGEDQDGEEGA